MARGQNITVTLRRVASGHKVCAFAMDDLNHAYSIAMVLVRSPEYSRCYAVATDWQGDALFNVQPDQVAQAPAPYHAPAPPPVYPQHQLQAYAPQPQYAPPAPRPVHHAQVVEAQFESDFAPPPGYPRLAAGRR
jgi:hypothetical protein